MSCESTSSLILKLWKKYGDEAALAGCTVAGAIAENPDVVIECLEGVKKAEEVAKNVISYWNTEIAGNTWAHIGPRTLTVGESEKGTITSIGDRTYITPTPITCNKVKLTLKETDGKGETQVDVCKMNSKGNCTKLKTWNFNDDAAGKKGHGNVELEIDDIKGKYLVVVLNGKDVFHSFTYKIGLEQVATVTAVKNY